MAHWEKMRTANPVYQTLITSWKEKTNSHKQTTAKENVLNSPFGFISDSQAGIHVRFVKDAYETVPLISPHPRSHQTKFPKFKPECWHFKSFPDDARVWSRLKAKCLKYLPSQLHREPPAFPAPTTIESSECAWPFHMWLPESNLYLTSHTLHVEIELPCRSF